jgi:hypothetical protein
VLRRQGAAKLHHRFRAGSVPAFHVSQEKICIVFMRFNKPETQKSRKIMQFSRKIRNVLQALFRGLPELLRPRISYRKKRRNVFRIGTYLRPKKDTSDLTGHKIFQREVNKNPVISRKIREYSRKICVP